MQLGENLFDPPSVLKLLYNEVYGVVDYVEMLKTKYDYSATVFREDDTEKYGTFLSQLLICVLKGSKAVCSPISYLQFSTQREVVARVIQRICEKRKNNVLSFGYGLADENSSLHVMFAANICSFFPNPTTVTVSTSILWETLLSRVGDDVMMHLLENCSLFMLVPPSCCYQISGKPVYNLLNNAHHFPELVKQRHLRNQTNIASHYVQRKFLPSKNLCVVISRRKKKQTNRFKSKTEKVYVKNKSDKQDDEDLCTNNFVKTHSSNALQTAKEVWPIKRPCMDNWDFPDKKRQKLIQGEEPGASHFDLNLKTKKFVECFSDAIKHDQDFDHCSELLISNRYNSGQEVPGQIQSVLNTNTTTTSSVANVTSQHQSSKGLCGSLSKIRNKTAPSKIFIEFGSILYSSRISVEGFPCSFILNILESSLSGSKKLLETIFINSYIFEPQQCLFERRSERKLPKRYWQMRCMFRELIQNHKKCPYKALIKKHCPARISSIHSEQVKYQKEKVCGGESVTVHSRPSTCKADISTPLCHEASDNVLESENDEKPIPEELHLFDLLKQHSSVWQVYMFVRECLHKVIPGILWGSSHNKCRFLKNVKAIMYSVKSDKISLSELMWKMRVEDCTWIRLRKGNRLVPVSEHLLREQILGKFFFWLMDTYVLQLLKSFYYITETLFQKNRLFFYRKSIWKKAQNIGLRKHLEKVELRLLSSDEIEDLQQQKNINLCSTLRFIPKINGLRPIAKMCNTVGGQQSRECRIRKIQQFNSQVRNLFSVLNYERSRAPNLVGSSVFGLDDIYKRWKTFVLHSKELKTENEHFYFVKADVKGAYDTIPHSKLKEVVSKILTGNIKENYCIRRYATVWMDSSGKVRKSFKQQVSTLVDFHPNMKQFVCDLQDNNIMQNAILVEQSLSLNQNSRKLLSLLEQLICKHVLRIKNKYYMQCCGIPQGSMLSALLCSLCYGEMENEVFCGIQQNGIFMRLIDDFLLVTPHLEHAKTFLRILAEGIPQYGCSLSLQKTAVNFPVDDIPVCAKVKSLPAHCLFQWCGLLLDTQTLEVYYDYSSYARTSIRSSLTFCHSTAAGKSMREKLIRILRLKCHSLFFDLKVNSLRTVYINVYKIFLLQSYRFHACVMLLPFHQGVRNNPFFFLSVISDMAPCLYNTFKGANKDIVGSKDTSYPFPFDAAQWLSCHAFTTKFSTHKAMYKCLLGPLRICKVQLTRRLSQETLQLLRTVTNGSLHEDFSTIIH
ncbi:telomerase reverse transcriptase [Pelodytes ibericus]